LHRKDLPGRPDLVFPRHKVALFVHGCFWHRHPGCRLASTPKSRIEYWQAKFDTNVARDAAAEQALRDAGWQVVKVWECETRKEDSLRMQLAGFCGLENVNVSGQSGAACMEEEPNGE
jgi:DNA mismatch endonuclease, patch repair protein